jgi:NAD(P)-dependent dehydrogenase (short-subunit alcohol dehydrogenase family)
MATINSRSFILVTGGAGGIGSAICRLLPAIGITPIVGFKTNATQAHNLANDLNSFAVNIDMTENNSIEKAIQIIAEKVQPSDSFVGVVLGASPPPEVEPFNRITSDHLSHQFRVNVIGSQLLLKGLIKNFFHKKKTGTVIGILTKAIGSDGYPLVTGMCAYVVAKAALNSLLSVCSAEYPWLKVRTVSPGFTRTSMLDVFDSRYLEMIQAQNKILTPEEVARLVIEKIKS